MLKKRNVKRPYKSVSFVVSFNIPKAANVADCRAYVEDAIVSHRGSLRPWGSYCEGDPGDVMFNLDTSSVRVRLNNRRKSVTITLVPGKGD